MQNERHFAAHFCASTVEADLRREGEEEKGGGNGNAMDLVGSGFCTM